MPWIGRRADKVGTSRLLSRAHLKRRHTIVETYMDDPPVLMLFDPTISFGVSESMVNDNEQGLITAGRRITRALGCCVRFVAHTGQQVARDKVLDQYAGRGGTALPDVGRMTSVMQPRKPKDKRKPPQECKWDTDSSIAILARPKLSYAPPNLPYIWIKRTGWKFEHFIEINVSPEEKRKAELNQIERFVDSQIKAGHYPNKTSLSAEPALHDSGLSRRDISGLVETLLSHNRIKHEPL